jgi:two-component system chemotaxis response regulator CheB
VTGPHGFPVVALVCSAGGLDALTRVLQPLPADFPGAVLVLQHVAPDAHSWLAEILARRSALPVVAAFDGAALSPGTVLVAPAGHHMLVTHQDVLALIASGPLPPARPSADLLLTSLALAVGSRAIAVVLSGHGHDGATGATAVHHFAGVVIASDEASSTEFSMPQATIGREGIIDHVVGVDEIAALLVRLVASATPPSPA